jgi:hypothetical protein
MIFVFLLAQLLFSLFLFATILSAAVDAKIKVSGNFILGCFVGGAAIALSALISLHSLPFYLMGGFASACLSFAAMRETKGLPTIQKIIVPIMSFFFWTQCFCFLVFAVLNFDSLKYRQ